VGRNVALAIDKQLKNKRSPNDNNNNLKAGLFNKERPVPTIAMVD
jgi:hypothetical protein